MTINDLPGQRRPREKMAREGATALSDAELLAIFLRVGVRGETAIEIGERLLRDHGGLAALGGLEIAQLRREHGLGLAKAAQLMASFELGARVARERASLRELDCPRAAFEVFAPLFEQRVSVFRIPGCSVSKAGCSSCQTSNF